MSKAAADRCKISLRKKEYELLIEGIDAIDVTKKVTDEIKAIDDLRYRLLQGMGAADARGRADWTEGDLT